MAMLEEYNDDHVRPDAAPLVIGFNVLRCVLGALFVCSGIAKLPVACAFVSTIVSVTHFTVTVSWIVGLLIVTCEVLGGLALLLGLRAHAAALALCALTAAFLWILTSAILQGKEITCNCFGVLGIHLSNRLELILDLILFNCLVFTVWASSHRESSSLKRRRRERLLTTVTVAAIIYIEAGLVRIAIEPEATSRSSVLGPAIRFAESNTKGFASSAALYRVLFVISVNDFNCPPCFDDFVALCDSINTRLPADDRERVVALVRPDNPVVSDGPVRLRRWIRATGILFPVLAAPDTLFAHLGVTKSIVSVINSRGDVIVREEIPVGARKREEILSYLIQ